MAHVECNCYISFWATFCPFIPLKAQKNQNFKKMKKTPGDIIILHMCTKKYDYKHDARFLRYCARWTDRGVDGSDTYHRGGGCPPN